MTEFDKPLKTLTEKEEFSALANWALNKLPPFQTMNLRQSVNGELYQTTLHKSRRKIVVGKPTLKTSHDETIRYDWPEEITYDTLSVDVITESTVRADIINLAKKEGRQLPTEPIIERASSQLDGNYQLPMESAQASILQTDRNYWKELTEEERNMLGELLDI